ncbi:MAG: aminotransferase class I/II-fold pyridoxal phosphate-dependent enzyme [Candidatus Hydrothermales bacterium]
MNQKKFETICVHTKKINYEIRDISTPLHFSSTFYFESAEEGGELFLGTKEGFIYTRLSNPTIKILEETLAELEMGEKALAFSSGMGAISALIFSVLKRGDKVIYSDPVYGGTYSLFKRLEQKELFTFIGIPARDFLKNLRREIDDKTKIIYIETPTNPTLDIIDIEETSKIAKEYNIILAVDNTFATPYHQKPLKLGANVVIHSLTKYLGGHTDLIGGALVGEKKIIDEIEKEERAHIGSCISPFNAWLALRGIKTLAVRMKAHSDNALLLAKFLREHPKVEKVLYPGLEDFEMHEIAKKQMTNGFSGMLSFIHKNGKEGAIKFINSLELCVKAVSLGAVETLIEHPASMTHSSMNEEELLKAGIHPGLVRISVGIEHIEDIIRDIDKALKNS